MERAAKAVLEEAARAVVADGLTFEFVDFHGLRKCSLPASLVEPIRRWFGFSAGELQIEIAGVLTDSTHEVHTHERTEAHVTCIGEDLGLPNPRDGYAFLRDRWLPVKLGDVLKIPVNVAHGFTVDPGGGLFVLRLESPPSVSPHGQEDYIAQPFTRWSRGPSLYEP